jgi:hypothetical protein
MQRIRLRGINLKINTDMDSEGLNHRGTNIKKKKQINRKLRNK